MGIEFCTSFNKVDSNFKQPSKSFGVDELPTNRAHSWPNPTSTSIHTGSGLLPVTYNSRCYVLKVYDQSVHWYFLKWPDEKNICVVA